MFEQINKKTRILFTFTVISILIFSIIVIVLLETNIISSSSPASSQLEKVINNALFRENTHLALSLSKSNILIDTLFNRNKPSQIEQANAFLESAKIILRAEVVYLMNSKGVVIASSTITDSDLLIGNDYSFRPYFKAALRGELLIYPALGVTTRRRGIYFSAPVRKSIKSIDGVIVVKIGVDDIEKKFSEYKDPICLVSAEKVIFASNRNDLVYKYLLPMSTDRVQAIKVSKQFIASQLLPFEKLENNGEVIYDGKKYRVAIQPFLHSNWSLVVFSSDKSHFIINKLHLAIALLLFLFLVLIIFFLSKIILERIKIEKELTKSRTLYHSLFSLAPDAICITSTDGDILSVNDSFVQLFKYSREELLTINIKKFYVNYKTDRPILLEALEQKKILRNYTLIFKDAEGNHLKTSNSLTYIDYNGIKCIESVIRDITDIVAQEEQLRNAQKREMIGVMSSGLAHDFNNILATISASAAIIRYSLSNADVSSSVTDMLATVEEAVEKGSQIIRKISSLAQQKESISLEIDLNQLTKDAVTLIKKITAKKVSLNFNPYQHAAKIKADPVQIEQILLNLCINAAHAMTIMRAPSDPQGGNITLTIGRVSSKQLQSYFKTVKSKNYFSITINDTGVGITKKVQQKIFDPFFTTKDASKGSGLGLAMVARITRQYGGLIRLESKPNVGTTFFLYFPEMITEAVE